MSKSWIKAAGEAYSMKQIAAVDSDTVTLPHKVKMAFEA